MSNSLQGILLDAYYKENKLYLTIKNKNNKKEDFLVDFNPYFYISFSNIDDNEINSQIKILESNSKISKISKIIKENLDNCYKLEFESIEDLLEIKSVLQKQELNLNNYSLHEYDLAFISRFFLDKSISNFRIIDFELDSNNLITNLKSKGRVNIKDLKIGCFDIEVLVNEDLKFPEMGVNPIISISYTHNNKKEVFFLKNIDSNTKVDIKELKKKLTLDNISLNLFDSEKELLSSFKEFIGNEDPDILYTYNGVFDLDYICKSYKRLFDEELSFKFRRVVFNKSKNKKVTIDGIVHFDVYRLMKLLNYFQVFNYSKFDLNSLYSKITGEEKIECSPKDMREKYFSGNYYDIIKYNIDDCLATTYLGNNYIGFVEETAHFLDTTLVDTLYLSASGMVERLFIKDYYKYNKIIPNKPTSQEITNRYKNTFSGAFVYQPSSGLYTDLAVLDFRSYHISLLIAYNISPETINVSSNDFTEVLGYKISKDKTGFVPLLLKDLLSLRMKFKEEMKTKELDSIEHKSLYARQYAIKILLASTYGYMGFAGSRWYCGSCLKIMYHLVRTKIQELITKFEEFGYQVVYGDTDSCFIKFNNIKKLGEDVKKINDSLPEHMFLELENIFKTAIFVKSRGGEKAAKKKYAMLDYNNNLKIKGFEYVRRDWCEFVKVTQKKVLEDILEFRDSKKAVEYIKTRIQILINKEVSNKDLIIQSVVHKKISNYKTSNPTIGAVENAKEQGVEYNTGDLVEYIITNKNTKSISSKAVISKLVEEKDYDVDYYLNNQLIPAIHPIIEVFGITKDELVNSKKQRGIGDFF